MDVSQKYSQKVHAEAYAIVLYAVHLPAQEHNGGESSLQHLSSSPLHLCHITANTIQTQT